MKRSKEELDVLFRRYLDGDLDDEQEREALHAIADDDEMRALLQMERTLWHTFSGEPEPGDFDVPEDFTSSVMDGIVQRESSRKSLMKTILTPVPVRPVYAAAALVLMVFGFGWLLTGDSGPSETVIEPSVEQSTQMVAETESQTWIRFVYIDDEDTEQVEVAGDFSEWEPISLRRDEVDGKSVWTGLVPISRGEHRYMFIRNGEEWISDPLAEVHRDDGFGNKNAVIYL